MTILTIIYILVIVWVILFKMSSIMEISELDKHRSINLLPFNSDEYSDLQLTEIIQNIIIFIPLGIYLKVLGKTNIFAIACGALFSLILEIFQFILGVGISDITDLMMNTIGAVFGVLIYVILNIIFKNTERLNTVLCIMATVGTIIFAILVTLIFANN